MPKNALTAAVSRLTTVARPTDKLTVTCDVIAVGVAVRDNKRDGGAPVPEEPCADESVDRSRNVHTARTGIEQQGTVLAEDQVQERLLEIGARGLA